ncbi:aspartate/glutamate racemase family protein [uncultured Polaribacter sp.]|uniref:aspartate/glutamate racemase family protein n=1 Tax=uncultured Polaribacter sp. TaxID=174711 RepID=UPI002638E7C3|nr:aspartate/glutamate racemase family protein [uncultured Polaribacter sp.]
MKGIVGILGLGKRSTNFYLETLQKSYFKIYGDYHTFPFLLYQIDFNTLNPYLPNQFSKLIPISQNLILELKKLPVKKWLIPNITFHETFDKLETKIPVFHPIALCLNFCKLHAVKEVTIFGTDYTMNADYLRGNLKNANISVQKIDLEDLKFINQFRKKVYENIEETKDIAVYASFIEKYASRSYVIIACTELSLVTEKINSKKIIDLAKLQINEVLKFSIN